MATADAAAEPLARLRANIERVVLGKPEVVRMALVALLAEGHLLVEDVPGVGKTLLAKALAKSLDCKFNRIQFTPDLLPSDLIGTSVYRQAEGEFEFQAGPLFAEVVLADEINRATPRTQSALLEAMSDRQVTVDGTPHALGPPFIVMATQNPYEFEGTYPLPESQLDRFLIRTEVGYPDRSVELAILNDHRLGEPVDELESVMSAAELAALQKAVRAARVEESVANYVLDVAHATRDHDAVAVGASTRAAIGLYRACQAGAVLQGRDFVTPEDVQAMAGPALAHRILTRQWRGGGTGGGAGDIIREILESVPVPR